MNAVSIRGEWVGTTIDGRFPLLEWLGGTGSSGVFLTELPGSTTAENTDDGRSRKAAIKLIPVSSVAGDRLAAWTSATALSHPHLVRILHFGRTEIDGTNLLYVVTELAEELLSQILPQRPLTPDETRQMLGPIIDALAYLHARGFVHAHLKPSNILVVNDEIKLSTDGLLQAGKPAPELQGNDIHRAPETLAGTVTDSADIWSLGVTLVEALTQLEPIFDLASDAEAQVPADIPKPFDEIARECLRADPSRRATISHVRRLLEGRPTAVAPTPHLPHRPHRLVERTAARKIPLLPLIVGFLLLVAIIIGLRMRGCNMVAAPTETERIAEPSSAEPAAPARSQASPAAFSRGSVLNRAEPDVPRFASNTIRGTVTVTVRVNVSEAGAVTNAELESRGPSAYFARLATESARNWTFKPPQQKGKPVASTWLLRYQFRRDGKEVSAQETAP